MANKAHEDDVKGDHPHEHFKHSDKAIAAQPQHIEPEHIKTTQEDQIERSEEIMAAGGAEAWMKKNSEAEAAKAKHPEEPKQLHGVAPVKKP
jgi:hypothetical protein